MRCERVTSGGCGVEVTSTGEVAREIDVDAAVVAAEVKRQFPLPMQGAEHVGQVALGAALPDVLLQRARTTGPEPSALKRTAPVNSPSIGP